MRRKIGPRNYTLRSVTENTCWNVIFKHFIESNVNHIILLNIRNYRLKLNMDVVTLLSPYSQVVPHQSLLLIYNLYTIFLNKNKKIIEIRYSDTMEYKKNMSSCLGTKNYLPIFLHWYASIRKSFTENNLD